MIDRATAAPPDTRRVLAEVPSDLYRAAKVRAAEQGTTLRAVVTAALAAHLKPATLGRGQCAPSKDGAPAPTPPAPATRQARLAPASYFSLPATNPSSNRQVTP